MKSDLYLKGILTVIAASLLFIAVELGTSSATAQPNQGPMQVVITGVKIMDTYGSVVGSRLPVDTGLLQNGGAVPVNLKYVYQSPIPVMVKNQIPITVSVDSEKKPTLPKKP
jgi:hypothetical protein